MPLTSFMPGPTYDAFTPGEFMQQAFDQPFSASQTFGESVVGGALSSFGLGTALKAGSTDSGRGFVPLEDQSRQPPTDLSQPQIRQETDQEVAARGDQTLNQEQYKSSPYYRPQIPWDDSMTANRAKDLSQYADAQSIREDMARRRPWTAMAGTFAGSALDPINYVPVLGEGAEAASVARFGVIGGRALVGAGDAALNVGIAGLLTAPIRQQFGDDISWQSQVSQMAMGAALGAGFSALGGVFKARADARAEAVRTELENNLSTIRNGQDAMATLHEAVAGLANDGEVNLGQGSLDRLDNLHSDMADTLPNIDARTTVAETPAAYAERVLGETMPEDMQRLSEIDRAIDINSNELDSLRSENMDNERFGPTRAAFIEAKQLDDKYQQLSAAVDKANSDKQRTQLQKQVDAVQARVQAIFDKLDPATVDRLEHLEQSIPLRGKALADARAARDPLAAKIDAARQGHIKEYLGQLGHAQDSNSLLQGERGAFILRHGRAGDEDFKSFQRDFSGARYDGNGGSFGSDGVYLDNNGKWTSGGVGRFSTKRNFSVRLRAKKMLMVTPDTLHVLRKEIGEDLTPANVKAFAKSRNYDAINVHGFDEASDKYASSRGATEENGQSIPWDRLTKKEQEAEISEVRRIGEKHGHSEGKIQEEIDRLKVEGKNAYLAHEEELQKRGVADPALTQDQVFAFNPENIDVLGDAQGAFKKPNFGSGLREVVAPAPHAPREITGTQAKPDEVSPEAVKAVAEVAKPDSLKKVAEANSVNAETGEFPEQAHLDQLDKEGRMTEEDHTAMQIANDNFKAAKSWGEALKAAVACLI